MEFKQCSLSGTWVILISKGVYIFQPITCLELISYLGTSKYILGIEKLIVGVNKMDSVDWSEQRFNEIKEEMTKMITTAGFKPKQVPFVP